MTFLKNFPLLFHDKYVLKFTGARQSQLSRSSKNFLPTPTVASRALVVPVQESCDFSAWEENDIDDYAPQDEENENNLNQGERLPVTGIVYTLNFCTNKKLHRLRITKKSCHFFCSKNKFIIC